MLVLARQLNERIVLPSVPATIEVVGIKPNGVRLGIEAPSSVTILREEVLRRGNVATEVLSAQPESDAAARLKRVRRVLSNRLQTMALSLNLVREQLDANADSEPRAMLRRIESELQHLDEQLRELVSANRLSSPSQDLSPCFIVEEEEFSI
jgi:carbon storage regulator CsrA